MDHLDAVRLQAAEKYVLGELTPELREQFEEHYFDCSECTQDLKTLTTFVTASRMVFDEMKDSPVPLREPEARRAGWFDWLKPMIAVPAMAALAAVIIFQNVVTIPSAKKQAAMQTVAEVYGPAYHLQGATRGGDIAKVTLRTNESFALDFDFTPLQVFSSYTGTLIDASGRSVASFEVGGEQTNKELHVVIRKGIVHAGNYEVVVFGGDETQKKSGQNSEVFRVPFDVVSEL